MDDLCEKYIHDHQNPLKKIHLPATKEFLSIGKQEESITCLENLKIALEYDRVERRCARLKAVWLPDLQAAKIVKTVGSLRHYGYQNRDGRFLYPEEVLYLLEINRLEVVYNEIPLSIQESFGILLKNGLTLEKYFVYKKLTIQGYRLLKKLKSEADTDEKTEEPCRKRRKIDDNSGEFSELFAKLRQKAPRNVHENPTESNPDYYVFLPNSTNNRPDFSLFIVVDDDPIGSISRNCTDANPKIFALFSKNGEFTGFYRKKGQSHYILAKSFENFWTDLLLDLKI